MWITWPKLCPFTWSSMRPPHLPSVRWLLRKWQNGETRRKRTNGSGMFGKSIGLCWYAAILIASNCSKKQWLPPKEGKGRRNGNPISWAIITTAGQVLWSTLSALSAQSLRNCMHDVCFFFITLNICVASRMQKAFAEVRFGSIRLLPVHPFPTKSRCCSACVKSALDPMWLKCQARNSFFSSLGISCSRK